METLLIPPCYRNWRYEISRDVSGATRQLLIGDALHLNSIPRKTFRDIKTLSRLNSCLNELKCPLPKFCAVNFQAEKNPFQGAPSPLITNEVVQHSKISDGYIKTLNMHMMLFTTVNFEWSQSHIMPHCTSLQTIKTVFKQRSGTNDYLD